MIPFDYHDLAQHSRLVASDPLVCLVKLVRFSVASIIPRPIPKVTSQMYTGEETILIWCPKMEVAQIIQIMKPGLGAEKPMVT